MEAVTGEFAIKYSQSKEAIVLAASELLKAPEKELLTKIEQTIADRKKLEKEMKDLKQKLISGTSSQDQVEEIGKFNLLIKIEENLSPQELRSFVDSKRNNPKLVIFAASVFESKTSLIIGLGSEASSAFNASDMVKEACIKAGGAGGGGRADIAQAGGFDFTKVNEALEYIKALLR